MHLIQMPSRVASVALMQLILPPPLTMFTSLLSRSTSWEAHDLLLPGYFCPWIVPVRPMLIWFLLWPANFSRVALSSEYSASELYWIS